MFLDDVDAPLAVVVLLEEGLVEEDDPGDPLEVGLVHAEQELPGK